MLLPTPPSLAEAIARKRREMRASRHDVGVAAGVSRQAVLIVEKRGHPGMSFSVSARIAYALGIPFEVISDALREALAIADGEMHGYKRYKQGKGNVSAQTKMLDADVRS